MTHAVLKKGWNENDLNGLAGKQAETYSPDRIVVTVIPRRSDDRDQRSQSSEALASDDNKFRRGDAWAGGSRCGSAG